MARFSLPALIAAIALLYGTPAVAAPFDITTADGSGADTYVSYQNGPTPAAGGAQDLIAWNFPSNWLYKVYLRFDLLPITRSLAGATLTVTTIDGQFKTAPACAIWGLNDGDAGESWGELTTDWTDAPANDTGNATGFLANATFLGVFENVQEGVPGGTGDFSGDALKNFLDADTDGRATLMITSPGGYTDFASRENTNGFAPPTLTVEENPQAPIRRFSITTADGSGADTYVQESAPGTNHGAEDNVIAWTNAGSYKVYVRFDLSAVTGSSAGARLICTTIDGQFKPATTVWGLDDGDAGESWGESTITWNNAPANDTSDATNFLGNATFLGVFGSIENVAGGTGDFSGDALRDFLNADTDGRATFMFASPNGFTYLAPKERADVTQAPPTLVVTASPPPGIFLILR